MSVIAVFTFAFCLGGAFLTVAAVRKALGWWRRRGWLPVVAESLYSEVRLSDQRRYEALCILRYSANGIDWVGQLRNGTGTEYAALRRLASRFSPGTCHEILYDPGGPDRIYLQSQNYADGRVSAICGVLGSLCYVAAGILHLRF